MSHREESSLSTLSSRENKELPRYIALQTDPLCYQLCLLRSPDFASFSLHIVPA